MMGNIAGSRLLEEFWGWHLLDMLDLARDRNIPQRAASLRDHLSRDTVSSDSTADFSADSSGRVHPVPSRISFTIKPMDTGENCPCVIESRNMDQERYEGEGASGDNTADGTDSGVHHWQTGHSTVEEGDGDLDESDSFVSVNLNSEEDSCGDSGVEKAGTPSYHQPVSSVVQILLDSGQVDQTCIFSGSDVRDDAEGSVGDVNAPQRSGLATGSCGLENSTCQSTAARASDVGGLQHSLDFDRCGDTDAAEVVRRDPGSRGQRSHQWPPGFCLLQHTTPTTSQQVVNNFSTLERAGSFGEKLARMPTSAGPRLQWTHYDRSPPPPPVLEEVDENEHRDDTEDVTPTSFKSSPLDSSYERAMNAHDGAGSSRSSDTSLTSDVSASRISNFFSRHTFKGNPLKRTKSVTKLERRKMELGSRHGGVATSAQLRPALSHESLLSGQQQHQQAERQNLQTSLSLVTELSAGASVVVRRLHPSILGRQHCIQVLSTDDDGMVGGPTRFYTCSSAVECDRWMCNLQRALQSHKDQHRHTKNSLQVWVLEAKALTAKKRYFCEVFVDDVLYARTSIKTKGDLCFWGERFDFACVPASNRLVVKVYRDSETKRKKKESSSQLVGTVEIPTKQISGNASVEEWYTLVQDNGAPVKNTASLRLKSRYRSLSILPLCDYSSLLQYVRHDYACLCRLLEPVVGVKCKEEIADCLVHIMHHQQLGSQLLADLITGEVLTSDDQRLTFRGNSLATKATECYLRLVGGSYLNNVLSAPLAQLLASADSLEVDPMRVANEQLLERQRCELRSCVERVWNAVLASSEQFPSELRETFHIVCERLKASSVDARDQQDNVLSSCVFLRFFCPAILSPNLFDIIQEYPDERTVRNLTLVAKTMQSLANFTVFHAKESYMEFMNEFIVSETESMRGFLRQISSVSGLEYQRRRHRWQGHIDLGHQLASLHQLLEDSCQHAPTSTASESCQVDWARLRAQLDTVASAARQRAPVIAAPAPPTPRSLSLPQRSLLIGGRRRTLDNGPPSAAQMRQAWHALSVQHEQRPDAFSPHRSPSVSTAPAASCQAATLPRSAPPAPHLPDAVSGVARCSPSPCVNWRPLAPPAPAQIDVCDAATRRSPAVAEAAAMIAAVMAGDVGQETAGARRRQNIRWRPTTAEKRRSLMVEPPSLNAPSHSAVVPPPLVVTRNTAATARCSTGSSSTSTAAGAGVTSDKSRARARRSSSSSSSPSPSRHVTSQPLVRRPAVGGAGVVVGVASSSTVDAQPPQRARRNKPLRRSLLPPPPPPSHQQQHCTPEPPMTSLSAGARRLQADSGPDSSEESPTTHGSCSQSRAHVRSKPRRHARQTDTSYMEYEDEIRRLREQMEALQARMHEEVVLKGKCRAKVKLTAANVAPSAGESGNYNCGGSAEPSTEQLANILSRLMTVENELQNEKCQVSDALTEKERLIEAQNRRIHSLNEANQELKHMLFAIVERGAKRDSNEPASSAQHLASLSRVSDTSDCRSGSC